MSISSPAGLISVKTCDSALTDCKDERLAMKEAAFSLTETKMSEKWVLSAAPSPASLSLYIMRPRVAECSRAIDHDFDLILVAGRA